MTARLTVDSAVSATAAAAIASAATKGKIQTAIFIGAPILWVSYTSRNHDVIDTRPFVRIAQVVPRCTTATALFTAASIWALISGRIGRSGPRNACTRIAPAMTQAAAKLGVASERKARWYQRGSKIWSETKAMRRGISSSRRVDSASSVRRSAASSSRQSGQASAWASASRRAERSSLAQRVSFPIVGFATHVDFFNSLCSTPREPRAGLQQLQRGIQTRLHGGDRAIQNLRDLIELEALIHLEQHGFALIVVEALEGALDGQRKLQRQQATAGIGRLADPGSAGNSVSGRLRRSREKASLCAMRNSHPANRSTIVRAWADSGRPSKTRPGSRRAHLRGSPADAAGS